MDLLDLELQPEGYTTSYVVVFLELILIPCLAG